MYMDVAERCGASVPAVLDPLIIACLSTPRTQQGYVAVLEVLSHPPILSCPQLVI